MNPQQGREIELHVVMANSINISCIVFFTCFLIVCYSLKAASHSHDGREEKTGEAISFYHSVKISTLLSQEDSCKPPKLGEKRGPALKVEHRYGPCSKHKLKNAETPTHFEILQRDDDRVKWIRSRFGRTAKSENKRTAAVEVGEGKTTTTLPAQSGGSIGSANYIVTVGLGTPENNLSLVFDTAGLIGLGRNKLSIVSQIASKYGRYFSYCLPSTTSSYGYLKFGKGSLDSTVMYTSLLRNPEAPSFYFLTLQAIGVGGKKLSISPSVLHGGGTMIDSGTVITRLPPAAYSALRSAFRKGMSKYPRAPALSILDTCYDFTRYNTIYVPKISLYYGDGAVMDLGIPGILFMQSISQACLAFAGNSAASDIGIIGNVQQQTFNIIYDVDGGKLGFGSGGCS
ncbi:hypothetical protein Ancab_001622 [Ancistrocladus abbreviatus]